MSTIVRPSTFMPKTAKLVQKVSQRVTASPFGGSEQAIDLLNDRWVMSCQIDILTADTAASIEAFIGAMRGQVNRVALYHFARPSPRGTIRGTLSLNVGSSQGSDSIQLTGCVPATGTLLAGDMLGVGNLLLMVQDDCTAVGGVVTVPITNRLRAAQSVGEAVTWDRPTALFRMLDTSGVEYEAVMANATTFEFGEAI